MTRRLIFFALAACLSGAFGWSNPQDAGYTRLARLSYIEGNVSFQHNTDADWSAASVNLPLQPGDRIYTGPYGRAEIEFDDGSAFRLAENTDVEVLSLSHEIIQLRLLIGMATLSVSGDADFEVDTPAAAFNPVRDGVYRFDVIENGDTDAIVRRGELEAANNQFLRRIQSGELLHLSPGYRGAPQMSRYDRRDEWDEWNDRRDADMRVYGNLRYLPDNLYMGAAELNRNGRWVNVETYGTAWVPYSVDDYWSPYSVGRWCYRPLFGWTWISYEPWGWLPYHYGRWYRSPLYGWCWLPGPAFSFNFWAPALVTFYSGPGWVSWLPLGPGDYYDFRHYHYNRGIYSHQLAQLRRLHTRRAGDHFNRDVRGAFRTARLDDFRNGSFDSRNRNTRWGNVERPWREGSLVRDRLAVQPTSKSFSAAPDRPATRPRATSTLPAVVRNIPGRDSDNRGRFTRITNPQIPAVSSRSLRSRSDGGSAGRGTSEPDVRRMESQQRPAAGSEPERGDRQISSPRWSGSRANTGNSSNTRSRETSTERTRSGNSAPSGRQSPSLWRNERAVPDRNITVPQRAPESKPRSAPEASPRRSEPRQQNNSSAARQGVGRWRSSSSGLIRSAQAAGAPGAAARPERSGSVRSPQPARTPAYSAAPRAGSSGRVVDSNPGAARSRQSVRAPSSSAPRSSGRNSWGNSNRGSGRSAPSYGAPRASGPSYQRSGGSRSSQAPSRGESSGRNSPQGNGRRR